MGNKSVSVEQRHSLPAESQRDGTVLIATKGGARGGSGPNYLVLTRHPGLGLALGRLAEVQHLSLMLFWSLETLARTPLLVADAAIVDQDYWRELMGGLSPRVQRLIARIPAVLITDPSDKPTRALVASDHISAVLPRTAGAAAILHAAIKALKDDPDGALPAIS